MNPLIEEFQQYLKKTIASLKDELKTLRTGRATPALIEDLMVETYGGQTKLRLMELATIHTDAPAVLAVSPFDPATIQDIEKALLKSALGLSARTQGVRILISIPPLSQEQRQKIMKLVGQKIEEKKESIRFHRDESRKKIRSSFEKKETTEDEKFRLEKDIDTLTHQAMEEISQIKELKDKEIAED